MHSQDDPGGIRGAWIAILLACAAMGAAAIVGSGRMGERSLGSAADGIFAETGTALAPASPAYALWPMLYLGLAAYAVWQALPAQRLSWRHARLRGWALVSMLLNAAWIIAAISGALLASVVIILALLATLVVTLATIAGACPSGRIDRLLVDGVFGLYLGWIMAMVLANIAAWLVSIGIGAGTSATWAAGAVSGLVVASVLLVGASGGRIAPAAGVAWALAWIAQGRLAGELAVPSTGLLAGAGAVVVVVAVLVVRSRPLLVPGRPPAENLLPAWRAWRDSHRRAPL